MIIYLLKSGLCLALLLAFYHFFLEREKMHRFNRFYLLGSVLFSFIAPSIIIYVEATQRVAVPVEFVKSTVAKELSFFDQYVTIQNIILITYVFVSSIFLIRFIKNLYHIIHKIRTNTVVKSKFAKFVPVQDEILPHTFWNYIFINSDEYKKGEIEEELFTHELAHVTQRHTIDVLIIEVLQILFWFNPLFFVLKKAVQLNHEFLADDKVISAHHNITEYQSLLLNKAAWKNEYYLASNLNYSLTKKRLLMMKTPNSRAAILVKKLALIPILAGLVFLFADRVEAQTKKKKPEVVEVAKIKRATDKQMKEYNTLVNKALSKQIFKKKDYQRLRYLYSLMSKKQKATVKNVKDVIPPPPPPPEKINVKEVQKKIGKLPKPVKIEVIDRTKKGKKIKVREIPPKPVKIEVIKKGGKAEKIIVEELPPKPKKAKKGKKHKEHKEKESEKEHDEHEELIEIIEETPVHESEREEVVDLLESPEVEEEHEEEREESPEVIEIQEETTIDKLNSLSNIEILNLPKGKYDKKITCFYNGKKISLKKAGKILAKDQKRKAKTLKINTVKDKSGHATLYITD
ncbi:M56 family metallopeptidase [Flavobacteriaceae bacterium S356]|uniref:M56 family metallopeptidase n=1 Tax=Asprobacillus argus TaxID=3076534 RepID=A0ABU3LGX3_9FLAO|nr:M56 family metallopeptidase [Flavobacteriaceae bacterium S356]